MKLGHILKETRIKRGISLSEVARELLIQEEYLEAIEDGIDDLLPSGTYKRIYTRAYCKFLGVEFKEPVSEEKTTDIISDDEDDEKQDDQIIDDFTQDEVSDLELPFDINRAFRIFLKVFLTLFVIYVIIQLFRLIF